MTTVEDIEKKINNFKGEESELIKLISKNRLDPDPDSYARLANVRGLIKDLESKLESVNNDENNKRINKIYEEAAKERKEKEKYESVTNKVSSKESGQNFRNENLELHSTKGKGNKKLPAGVNCEKLLNEIDNSEIDQKIIVEYASNNRINNAPKNKM